MTPKQLDGVSCGVCVLVEIQRIADRKMGSRCVQEFTEAELLRCRAKWACEIMLNPPLHPPPPQVGTIAEAGELTDNGAPGPDDEDRRGRRPEGAGAPTAQKRPRSEPSDNGRKSAATKRRRHEDQVLEETSAHSQARASGAGIPGRNSRLEKKNPG